MPSRASTVRDTTPGAPAPQEEDEPMVVVGQALPPEAAGSLEKLIAQAQQLGKQESDTVYPDWVNNGAKRALYDFGFPDENLVIEIDTAVRHTKPDHWIGNAIKEKKVRRALIKALPTGFERIDELMALVKARDEYR